MSKASNLAGFVPSIEPTNNLTVGNIVGTAATFTGNVTVGGTLTYEDVTNIDSVGLITARSGIEVTGGDVTLGTGVTISGSTANTFTVSTNGTKRIEIQSDGDIDIDGGGVFYDATNNRLGIGTTSPAQLLEVSSSAPRIRITDNNTAASTAATFVEFHGSDARAATIFSDSDGINIQADAAGGNNIAFKTNGSNERGRIDSAGRFLVGASSAISNLRDIQTTVDRAAQNQVVGTSGPGASSALISYNAATSGYYAPHIWLAKSNGASVGSNVLVNDNEDLGVINFAGNDGSSFLNAATILAEVDGTPGTNDMPGRLVFSTTADGASSPTERMRITSDGYFGFNKQTISYASAGFQVLQNGAAGATVDGSLPFFVNRLTNDGDLVHFYQASTLEGSISVSGSTVSYNGAHLSRWSQLPGVDPYDKTVRPEILRGTIMSNLDEMCDWTCPTSGDCQDNEQLNKTKISDVEGDKNVAGVFQSWDDDDDTWVNDFYLAMTGDFIIRIAAGTTVERGDLLMSAGDGTAKPQDDDIIRSKTIAKVTSTNVSCTYTDGSYCVPCVLMAC